MIAAGSGVWFLWPAVMVVAIGLTALFCGLETGVYVLNKIRLDLHAEAGSRQARRLRRMLHKPDNLLVVLLIGTNLASYAVTFAASAMFVLAGAGARTQWYALAAVTPLLFVFGDSVPKDVFHRLAERLTYRLSWVLAAADVLFKCVGLSPLVRGASWLLMWAAGRGSRRQQPITDEQVAAIFAEGSASGALTHLQAVMAERVMKIADVKLADVMVPMGKVAWVPCDIGREDLLKLAQQNNYSRLPVRDADGAVVGVLDIFDALAEAEAARPADRMTEPLILPEHMIVTDALYRLQRAHRMMAIVQSTTGQPVGLVTIKDLVEEIVGELEEW